MNALALLAKGIIVLIFEILISLATVIVTLRQVEP